MVPLVLLCLFGLLPSKAIFLPPVNDWSVREARHVLPLSTFTSLAAQFREEDNKDGRSKQKREAIADKENGNDGLLELALRRAEELGLQPEVLQGRLGEVLDVERVLDVVEEGRKMADIDLLREMFWQSGSLEELQASYKEKLAGLMEEGARAVNLKKGEELLKEGEGMLTPIQ